MSLIVRPLKRQIESLSRSLLEQGKQDRFFLVPPQLFVDLESHRRIKHTPMPIPQKGIFPNVPRKYLVVQSEHEKRFEGHTPRCHDIEYLHPPVVGVDEWDRHQIQGMNE